MHDTVAPSWAGPLQGIRVLDFTRVLAGPAASLALADLGAEVLKIEPPGTGDETRLFPAAARQREPLLPEHQPRQEEHRRRPEERGAGVALVKDLAAKCDILIENYRPGVMDRLGLGYETLSAINPRLIYCAISGYGMTGPLRDRPSFDIVLQAMSGALSVNGEAGRPPTKLGIPLGDLVGGINGPIGILAALHERNVTGRGRLIDVSLIDGLIGMLGYLAQLAFFTGEDPKPQGLAASQPRALRNISRAGRLDHRRLPDEQLLGAHLRGAGHAGLDQGSALRHDREAARQSPRWSTR